MSCLSRVIWKWFAWNVKATISYIPDIKNYFNCPKCNSTLDGRPHIQTRKKWIRNYEILIINTCHLHFDSYAHFMKIHAWFRIFFNTVELTVQCLWTWKFTNQFGDIQILFPNWLGQLTWKNDETGSIEKTVIFNQN